MLCGLYGCRFYHVLSSYTVVKPVSCKYVCRYSDRCLSTALTGLTMPPQRTKATCIALPESSPCCRCSTQFGSEKELYFHVSKSGRNFTFRISLVCTTYRFTSLLLGGACSLLVNKTSHQLDDCVDIKVTLRFTSTKSPKPTVSSILPALSYRESENFDREP